MRIYAERPGRAVLQVLADVAVVAWVVLVVVLARDARAAVVLQLRGPGAAADRGGRLDPPRLRRRRRHRVRRAVRRRTTWPARWAAGADAGDSLAVVRARARGDRRHRGDGRRGRDRAARRGAGRRGLAHAAGALGANRRSGRRRAGRRPRPARAAGPDPPLDPAACSTCRPEPGRSVAARRPAAVAALADLELGGAGAAVPSSRSAVTVTRRVSVMTGRPAPSDGSSSATRTS